jgi:ribosomal protein S18 acetylase RimI-like enzyme
MPSERPLFERFLDKLPGPFQVLENAAGTIVACGGYAIVEDQNQADFCWGMVQTQWQGQGLGKQLSLERLRQIRANPQIKSVRLNTSQHTVGFYESLGFRRIAITRDGYGPGLDRYDMEWELR